MNTSMHEAQCKERECVQHSSASDFCRERKNESEETEKRQNAVAHQVEVHLLVCESHVKERIKTLWRGNQ